MYSFNLAVFRYETVNATCYFGVIPTHQSNTGIASRERRSHWHALSLGLLAGMTRLHSTCLELRLKPTYFCVVRTRNMHRFNTFFAVIV